MEYSNEEGECDMIRKIRLTLLFVLLASCLGAVSMQLCAATTGRGKTGKAESEDRSKSSDHKDDYYETLDIEEGESYDTKDEVCAYLVQFHCLPENYMTKKEARSHGWEGGALNQVISGKCIGGDYFGNYEGMLPEVNGRDYHECDIDTLGKSGRGAKRIIYSGDDDNGDWNIYYTDDHYETFELLWGKDDYE